jgi:hypothetical protein
MDYFADGHRGAAIIAAYYFCREVDIEDGACNIIRAMIDEHWTHTDLCAPLPAEAPAPDLLHKITDSLERSLDGLREVGHNVIFASLALKALRQVPEAVTPSRVHNICRLIERFTLTDGVQLAEGNDIPRLSPSPEAAAELILSELLTTIRAFDGRGQGWSRHLLTYGRAMLDLRNLGHRDLAAKGDYAFQLFVKRIRMGPSETDKPMSEHPPTTLRPQQRAYWEGRKDRSVGIGHVFKYPYGFYGLMELAQDRVLKERYLQAAYHIF